jgi:hypothetical protein
LGQLANFEGVAEIIRGCQECMQPWGDNEPVDLEYSQRDLAPQTRPLVWRHFADLLKIEFLLNP